MDRVSVSETEGHRFDSCWVHHFIFMVNDQMLKYTITLDQNRHVYIVNLEFTPITHSVTLKLPTWIPGSYMIREFSKNITALYASQKKLSLPSLQINKNSWQISASSTQEVVTVHYEVYAYDSGIRSAYLDSNRGYFNPSSLCLYIEGSEFNNHEVMFSNLPKTWNVVSGLACDTDSYTARSYDELIDHPFELGELTKISFLVKDTPHFLVLSGNIHQNFSSGRFIADISKICNTAIDLFGGVAPFASYTFLLNLSGEIFTGLEHRNSTALMAPYYALPDLAVEISDDYLKLLCLISHEYFHSWNVKRIKPQVFNPYNLENENYTKLLWWFEGVTSYYDDLIVYKAGLIDQKRYLQLILDNINNVYKFQGATTQTLTNSSLTSWIKYYRQDENSPNSIVSYYVKGALVGMCLDLLIRDGSKGLYSLDTVLLGLYNKWLNDEQGIDEDQLPELIKEFTKLDLHSEINEFVETTHNLPLKKLLDLFGLDLISQIGHYADMPKISDMADKLPDIFDSKPDLGIKLVKAALGYKITQVYDGSCGQASGLAAFDIIIALNGTLLSNWDKQISLYHIGDTVQLSLFRQDRLLEIPVLISETKLSLSYLQIKDQLKLDAWLNHKKSA